MKHFLDFSRKKSALLPVLLVFTLFFAVSCDVAEEEDDNNEPSTYISVPTQLLGTWEYNGAWTESYTITSTTFVSSGSYEGDNIVVTKTNDTSGYIYMKYTKSMNADWTYSTTAPDVGKWYAVAYKNLTATSVSLSGAYKASGATSKDTRDEAKTEFTIENGYFSAFSELTKK